MKIKKREVIEFDIELRRTLRTLYAYQFINLLNLYAQIIDDQKGVTLCSASSLKSGNKNNSCNIENAKILAVEISKVAKEKGISKLYLDRGPNIYHGIIKAFADEARSSGIKF